MNEEIVKLLQEIRTLLRLKICQEEISACTPDGCQPLTLCRIEDAIARGYKFELLPEILQKNFSKLVNIAYQDMQTLGLVKNQTDSERCATETTWTSGQ